MKLSFSSIISVLNRFGYMPFSRILFFAVFLISVPVFAQNPADPATEIRTVIRHWKNLNSFKATLSIDGGAGVMRGEFSYQRGRFHLQLNDGRVVASNGRELIVYTPETQVAGKQNLDPENAGLGGPDWLNGYSVDSSSGRTAHLVAENPSAAISEVKLRWAEDYTIQLLSIKDRKTENWLNITISNLRTVESFPANIFSWKPPAGSRTVENPLNQSN